VAQRFIEELRLFLLVSAYGFLLLQRAWLFTDWCKVVFVSFLGFGVVQKKK
jgi:hypothetical protein